MAELLAKMLSTKFMTVLCVRHPSVLKGVDRDMLLAFLHVYISLLWDVLFQRCTC